jgi:hypothetical protein
VNQNFLEWKVKIVEMAWVIIIFNNFIEVIKLEEDENKMIFSYKIYHFSQRLPSWLFYFVNKEWLEGFINF